jgi:acetolactate synthase-1/2/3 large subunit
MHGGDLVAQALKAHGVEFLFTLCGGHISPILVGSKALGIRVVDVRHEANAVFAADAVARLTGIPGVAAVTAGPGVTNTLTAIKNAQQAQSPVVVFGGATATALRGRGALQDIDQMALIRPHVKWCTSVEQVRNLTPAIHEAFAKATDGVPGPVFVEIPIDLLYGEEIVREWYGAKGDTDGRTLGEKALKWYLNHHVNNLFDGANEIPPTRRSGVEPMPPDLQQLKRAAAKLEAAEKPVMIVGSQTLCDATQAASVALAVEQLGVPVYLSGMGRGLLGAGHPLQMRHKRRMALKEADLVLLAGVPCDFRLDYGQHIRSKTPVISANRSLTELYKNRGPTVAIHGDPGLFLRELSRRFSDPQGKRFGGWRDELAERDRARDEEIAELAKEKVNGLNPLQLCRIMEEFVAEDSVFVADGGDFVATAAYTVRPRSPLSWLDPGVFGTLGVGGGFALGAQLVRPNAEVWIVYGDGSVGYTLPEFDTFCRHQIPVIAVVGNDASWQQIARDQVELLGDDVGVTLRHTDYHLAAEGFGGKGILLDDPEKIPEAFRQAKAWAREGHPVLINAIIGKTDFRKGSISV